MPAPQNNLEVYSRLDKIKNLPAIPEIMFDAISVLKSEPGNVIKIAEIIGQDQGMVTRILSVANSPLYGMLRKVTTLEFAIMIMGSRELENVITAISLSNAIRFAPVANFNDQDYWKHSMTVGLTAKDLARRLAMPEIAGDAFIGGMLHDIGVQLIVKYFPDEYQQIFSTLNESNKFIDLETSIMGLSHQELGAYLLKKWDLPISLVECVQFHHNPLDSAENKILVAIVQLADFVTNQLKTSNNIWDEGVVLDHSLSKLLGFESYDELIKFYTEYSELMTDVVTSKN
ncbi:MAG: HDOD domain-containing protein [Ignavibacteriales bacterium]|nr:HDOD domain-containing protein [Ignavibacteriota bacterium]MCB9247139.1 HDOD domain-containing protein [Ignavibacteriales bacterium]